MGEVAPHVCVCVCVRVCLCRVQSCFASLDEIYKESTATDTTHICVYGCESVDTYVCASVRIYMGMHTDVVVLTVVVDVYAGLCLSVCLSVCV
jgi:hypothetical protein